MKYWLVTEKKSENLYEDPGFHNLKEKIKQKDIIKYSLLILTSKYNMSKQFTYGILFVTAYISKRCISSVLLNKIFLQES